MMSWCSGMALSTALTKERRPALFMRCTFQAGKLAAVDHGLELGCGEASGGQGNAQVGD
jgi:hypothetical protein